MRITEPVHLDNWLIVPVEQDSSPVPERTMDRVQALYASGLHPKGFVVVHEAPKLLPASIDRSMPGEVHISTQSPAQRQLWQLARYLPGLVGAGLLAAAGAALLATLVALAVSVLAVFGLMAALGGLVMAIDPILIAVTDDDTWIEIDRWWTE